MRASPGTITLAVCHVRRGQSLGDLAEQARQHDRKIGEGRRVNGDERGVLEGYVDCDC